MNDKIIENIKEKKMEEKWKKRKKIKNIEK